MRTVSKSGQVGLTGSDGGLSTSPTQRRSCTQLEIFNARTLRRLVISGPGASKGTKATKPTRSGTDSAEAQ